MPSLFTLDLAANEVTQGLAGISVPEATVRISWREAAGAAAAAGAGAGAGTGAGAGAGTGAGGGSGGGKGGGKGGGGRRRGGKGPSFESSGPCLITHKGLSGPACLRLSALAAREVKVRVRVRARVRGRG